MRYFSPFVYCIFPKLSSSRNEYTTGHFLEAFTTAHHQITTKPPPTLSPSNLNKNPPMLSLSLNPTNKRISREPHTPNINKHQRNRIFCPFVECAFSEVLSSRNEHAHKEHFHTPTVYRTTHQQIFTKKRI
ncbi:hypothetical protein AMTRI_Chr10g6300 [Amborella trichopoda]